MAFQSTLKRYMRQSRAARRDVTQLDCPRPKAYGGDELKCPLCGMIWAVDEERPPCQRTRREA